MGYWDDYIIKRPGTPGGEQARLEDIRVQSSFPSGILPGTDDYSGPERPPITGPPRVKRQLTKIDFIIGGVVFLVTWRSLIFIAVVVVVLIFLVSMLK